MLDSSERREVLASEGGHASFAPRDETEMGILRFLLKRYEHVSWERVLSGNDGGLSTESRNRAQSALDTLTGRYGYVRESARDLVGALASLRYR